MTFDEEDNQLAAQSKHLEEIIARHNRTANLQVVFIDIEKYSKRRTLTQIAVIDSFTECLRSALTETSKYFVGYAQSNNINFQTDVICLPTGDGAAIVFSFDGLHDIHLHFALALLKVIKELNDKSPCDKFIEHGWCNCHANLFVRIGVSEGRGIIYRDINEGYNVAGGVINMAARVMGQVDRRQIAFTEEAFRQIVDMVDDPNLTDRFVEFADIQIKHGLKITLYQYIGKGEDYINANLPEELSLRQRMEAAANKLGTLGLGPQVSRISEVDNNAILELVEGFVNTLSGSTEPPKQIKQVEPDESA